MACNNEIHENDVGTEFLVTIVECTNGVETPIDISSATLMQIVFRNPAGLVVTKAATFTSIASGGTGDGTDGRISYFTVDQDLTPTGDFKIQGIVTTPMGKWSSTIDKFKVTKNLL